mgnify:CR=1 FL=1
MDKKPNIFEEHLHNENYLDKFTDKLLTHTGMIYDAGREKESLNGWWNFGIDQYDTCLRAKWFEERYQDTDGYLLPMDFNFDQWEKIYVPSCWNLQRERYFLYEGSAIYTRTFRYVKQGEERVFIKFCAANYEARVFLNKEFIGFHQGGSTPFYVEVTGELQEANRLLVVVTNTRKRTNVPCENTDWFNYGGIYRDVELIRVPETFIKDFHLYLIPESNFGKICLNLTIVGKQLDGEALLTIEELEIKERIPVKDGQGSVEIGASPELWSPDLPKLYDVELTYAGDRIKEKIGFREIKVLGKKIILNGKKLFLKGVCAHEESVINGKAVSEEEIIENIRLAKEMNCNYIRLAHYPHSEKVSRIADQIGIMLWEEIPVYWAIDFTNPETYCDAENQLAELIIRDRNRASVIIWSVGNENADTDERLAFMSSLAQKSKELDPTRLVSAACLIDQVENIINDRLTEYLDVIGINEYYGWYNPNFSKLPELFVKSQPDKPVIISEFGAGAKAGFRGTVDDYFSEGCQKEVYKKQIETFAKIPYIQGTSPWILFDFRCPRRLHNLQDYYNRKGLLSEDKSYKKPAFYVMKEFYANK